MYNLYDGIAKLRKSSFSGLVALAIFSGCGEFTGCSGCGKSSPSETVRMVYNDPKVEVYRAVQNRTFLRLKDDDGNETGFLYVNERGLPVPVKNPTKVNAELNLLEPTSLQIKP